MTKNLKITKSEIVPDALIPITIGITGHRDIHPDAFDSISAQLKVVFNHFKQQYPDTPFIVVSPLAEGADQLAAEIASELKIELYAVLPMSEEEYKKDFDKEKVNKKFNKLLSKAAHQRILPEFDPMTQRDLCYANVGKWVVDQCDVLIAIWDGNQNELTGGTGEIVNYALTGELPSLEQHLTKDWIALQRPVLHIDCTRQSGNLDSVTNTETHVYHTHKDLEDYKQLDLCKSVSKIASLKSINDFNHVISKQNGENGYPLLGKNDSEFPDHLQFIHQLYLKTDLVANEYQTTLKRYTLLFYSLTTALMITLLLYFRIFPLTVVLATYVLIYVAIILISMRIKNSAYQKKYHLFRIISELSRLFFFFSLSKERNGNQSIKSESILNNHRELQYITRKLGSDNEWVVDVLRKIKLFETLNPSESTFEYPMMLVKKHWIEDQYNYFTKAQKRDDKKLRRLDIIGIALFAISLLCGLSLFIISLTGYIVPELFKPIVNMIIAVSAGFGGIIKTYIYTMGYNELSGRYKLMSELFGNSIKKMKKINSNHDAVFEQLWWEAVMENVEWYSLKNSRLIKTLDLKKIVQNIMKLSKNFT